MNEDYYTRERVESAIILHFGIKQPKIKCSQALRITQSTLSRNLKKLTPAFIQRLKGIGVVFDNLGIKEKSEPYSSRLEKLIDKVFELEEMCHKYETEHKRLLNRINELKKECKNGDNCLITKITLNDIE